MGLKEPWERVTVKLVYPNSDPEKKCYKSLPLIHDEQRERNVGTYPLAVTDIAAGTRPQFCQ